MFSNLLVKGVIKIWGGEETLNRNQHSSYLKGWTPLVFENVEANSANFVNVRMIDFCSKEHFGRDHRVLVRKE